eukprot:Clim_evm22s50 gene=Clim_evmTU22s50
MQFRIAEIAVIATLLVGAVADRKIQVDGLACEQNEKRSVGGSLSLSAHGGNHRSIYVEVDDKQNFILSLHDENLWISVTPNTRVILGAQMNTVNPENPEDDVVLFDRFRPLMVTRKPVDDGEVTFKSMKNGIKCEILYTVVEHVEE